MTPPRRLSVAAGTIVAITLASGMAVAGPIIPNGDFSQGDLGFSSSYLCRTAGAFPNYALMRPEGTYTVGTSPGSVHSLWSDFGDHTTGQGNMLLVNGNRSPDVVVWTANVDVKAGTNYGFSAWTASVHPGSPASLAFSINGILLDAPCEQSSTTGLWQQCSAGWHSGSSTSAVLSLIDRNTAWNGNDFALDDISLNAIVPPVSAPEPSSLILLGSGLTAAARILKRRKQ